MNDNAKKGFTSIHFDSEGITVEYAIGFKKNENGKLLCYIPVFDFMFSAKTEEEGNQKGDAMIDSFLTYFEKEESIKSLIFTIHKMGFRSPQHNYVMQQLLNKKSNKANMKVITMFPETFADADIKRISHKKAA